MIEISNLGFSYEGGDGACLQDVSLSVKSGEVVVVTGGAARERPPSSAP